MAYPNGCHSALDAESRLLSVIARPSRLVRRSPKGEDGSNLNSISNPNLASAGKGASPVPINRGEKIVVDVFFGLIKSADVEGMGFTISVPSLNPAQIFKVFLRCMENLAVNQIQSIELTHSKGVGLNKHSSAYTKLDFRFFFMEFEYDLNAPTLRLLLAGPRHSQ